MNHLGRYRSSISPQDIITIQGQDGESVLLSFADVVRQHVPPEELALAQLRECRKDIARAFAQYDRALAIAEGALNDAIAEMRATIAAVKAAP